MLMEEMRVNEESHTLPTYHSRSAVSIRVAQKVARFVLIALLGVGMLVIVLAPIAWAISTSFKTPVAISTVPPQVIPASPTSQNYERLLSDRFTVFARNSLLYTSAAILCAVGFGSLLAYAMARFRFRGKGAIVVLLIMTLVTPYMAILAPLFFIFSMAHLTDTWITLPLVYTAQTIPFAAWFLKGYFEVIPEDMEHAAMVDGYSRLGAIRRILLPMAMPGFVTAAVFTALTAWNDYITAIFLLNSNELQTLPVATFYYLGTHGREWGPLTAAAALSVIPVLVLFITFRKYFLGGLLSGAIKG